MLMCFKVLNGFLILYSLFSNTLDGITFGSGFTEK